MIPIMLIRSPVSASAEMNWVTDRTRLPITKTQAIKLGL